MQKPNYARLVKISEEVTNPPEWLIPGCAIASKDFGRGTVVAIVGSQLIANFAALSQPISFDWATAIENKSLTVPSGDIPLQGGIDSLQISQPLFGQIARELADSLVSSQITPPHTGKLQQLPCDLPQVLLNALHTVGVNQLYSHQIKSLQALRAGQDICVVTPTASGKTWCFNIAVLESTLTTDATALYIYPLKALAVDQFTKLQALVSAFPSPQQKIGLLTGDVPPLERQRLFTPSPPQILGVSPDLLHYQLYAVRKKIDGEQFREFLRRLRFIVVDESHVYLSSFASNFANLLRRLRVAVDTVGGNSERLQYIFSSATVGNPREMATMLTGRSDTSERLKVVDESGATTHERTTLVLQPSSSSSADAAKIILSALDKDLSGICFCNSRSAVKNLLYLLKQEATRNKCSYLADKVVIFYGGLTSDRRRSIIAGLKSGQIKWILSTSALEAGIDLPELDCCLIRGFPGSIMNFRQRVGRCGRKSPGLAIFLPVAQNYLDNYYSINHQLLESGKAELISYNADYPVTLGKHLMAAAVESGIPLSQLDSYFGAKASSVADELLKQRQLFVGKNHLIYGKGYPHRDINLRGSSLNTVKLVDGNTGEEFEELSLDMAHREVFTDAIYSAQSSNGQIIKYKCRQLELENHQAILAPIDPDSTQFTKSESSLDIRILELLDQPKTRSLAIPAGQMELTLAWGEITSSVTGYQLCDRTCELGCLNSSCSSYRRAVNQKHCKECNKATKSIETVKIIDEVAFEEALVTKYLAPVVKVSINKSAAASLGNTVVALKEEYRTTYGENIPSELLSLWQGTPTAIALHSFGHQMVLALPLVILGSSLDINYYVQEEEKTIGYFYDSTPDGNGASESIYKQFEDFASVARSLAHTCDCSFGCPKCLYIHVCPQDNEALNKVIGMDLLAAISPGE